MASAAIPLRVRVRDISQGDTADCNGEDEHMSVKTRMELAADLRRARSLLESTMKSFPELPEDELPVDPARAEKTLNDAFLMLDAAIDELEA
jgi:hypothetical protein